MQTIFLIMLFIIGACFGSFLCCQARRMHYKLKHKKPLGSRSVCLSCNTKLKWYDNIPIFSWFLLRGKCRKCGKKIGITEIISEIGLAIAFMALGTTIDLSHTEPLMWIIFVFIILFTTIIGFLAIYDGLYGELPTKYLFFAILLGVIIVLLKLLILIPNFSSATDYLIYFAYNLASIAIFGGLYLILYKLSKGKWVGDGDWLLATAIALALGHPWLTLVSLFLTNLFALIYALPQASKNPKIHLGPFMMAAYIVTLTFANLIQSVI